MKIFILFLLLFTSFDVFAQERSLTCKCTQETYKVESLQLYIRNSPFDRELIGTAQIVNGVATFAKDIPETDTYFMQDPETRVKE